jgi:flagellar hook-basal body complex protein FliE
MAGSSGTLGTVSDYSDSTMSVSQGTTQVTYAVTAVSGSSSSVMVAITDQVDDTQNNLVETDVTNYNLTNTGVLTFVSGTVQNASESLQVVVQ